MASVTVWRRSGVTGFATVKDLEMTRSGSVLTGYDALTTLAVPDAVVDDPATRLAALRVFRWVAAGSDLPAGFASGVAAVDAIQSDLADAGRSCRGM